MKQKARAVEAGVTVAEILAVLLTVAILSTIGLASLGQLSPSFRRAHTREQLRGDIMIAKAQSLAERSRVILQKTSEGYQLGFDYPPYSPYGQIDQNSTLNIRRTLPPEFSLELQPDGFLTFDSRGNLIDADTGELTQATVRLSDEMSSFFEGTVYPTAVLR